jgi:hypothetical protein
MAGFVGVNRTIGVELTLGVRVTVGIDVIVDVAEMTGICVGKAVVSDRIGWLAA